MMPLNEIRSLDKLVLIRQIDQDYFVNKNQITKALETILGCTSVTPLEATFTQRNKKSKPLRLRTKKEK